MYLCSYSQSRRIWTDSLGRLPLLLLLPEAAEEERSRGISMLSSSSVSLPDAATMPEKGQGPTVTHFYQQGKHLKAHLFRLLHSLVFSQPRSVKFSVWAGSPQKGLGSSPTVDTHPLHSQSFLLLATEI